uniref:Uncharacterized protein n=1 Tax=Siphoviridae sp. ctvI513 TaxID=2827965 RepID=A0A8S5TJB3_9CAUD|nr:MAG TPA: hypothetical protein [Siphoviridae sp. ctvI513]DAN21046.1 MAG TPA: hypothetical protein [Caudoviricetes sp.]
MRERKVRLVAAVGQLLFRLVDCTEAGQHRNEDEEVRVWTIGLALETVCRLIISLFLFGMDARFPLRTVNPVHLITNLLTTTMTSSYTQDGGRNCRPLQRRPDTWQHPRSVVVADRR